MLPWLVGVVPFGTMVGVTAAAASDVPTVAGLLTGTTIYSGSAQLSAIELLDDGAPLLVVLASVLVINARLLLYGSSIAPHWRGTGRGFRVLAAYLLVDPSYAVGMHRYGTSPDGGHAYYLGAGVTLWVAWLGAMVAGATLGEGIPVGLGLEYAVPLFLLAEVVAVARTRPTAAAALVGAAVAVTGAGLPLHGGLPVAVVLGVVGAVATERAS